MYKAIAIIAPVIVIGLIILSFRLAKKSTLTCPDCGSKNLVKTGNKRDIDRSRRSLIASPIPEYELEYQCNNCNKTIWSSIEKIYS